MNPRIRIAVAVAAAALLSVVALVPARPVRADPQGEMVRSLAGKYRGSLVTLAIVVKVSAAGFREEQNTEMEVDGFILDPSGLVATTNSAIDPAAMFAGMMGEEMAAQITSKVVSVRILTATGEDLPARVVLRDTDRNLAFVRPLQPPAAPLTPVDFASGGGKAQIGEPVYILGRLGKVGNRSPMITLQRLISVLDRPRTLYVLGAGELGFLGNVVFNERGEPLGLSTLRTLPGGGRRGRGFDASENLLPVIIPAEDVWEVARQAPQAKDVRDPNTAAPAPKPAPTGTKPAPSKPAPTRPGRKL